MAWNFKIFFLQRSPLNRKSLKLFSDVLNNPTYIYKCGGDLAGHIQVVKISPINLLQNMYDPLIFKY